MATMAAAILPIRGPRSPKAIQRRNRMQTLLINELSDPNSRSQKLLGHVIGALRVVGCLSQVRWTHRRGRAVFCSRVIYWILSARY